MPPTGVFTNQPPRLKPLQSERDAASFYSSRRGKQFLPHRHQTGRLGKPICLPRTSLRTSEMTAVLGGPTFTNCPLCKAFQKVCWSLSGDGKDLCNDLQSCPWGLRLLDTGWWPEREGGGLHSGDSWGWGGCPNPVPSPMTWRSRCL